VSFLLDDHKETRSYWKVKAGALDCTVWNIRNKKYSGPVARQNSWWWNNGNKILVETVKH